MQQYVSQRFNDAEETLLRNEASLTVNAVDHYEEKGKHLLFTCRVVKM